MNPFILHVYDYDSGRDDDDYLLIHFDNNDSNMMNKLKEALDNFYDGDNEEIEDWSGYTMRDYLIKEIGCKVELYYLPTYNRGYGFE